MVQKMSQCIETKETKPLLVFDEFYNSYKKIKAQDILHSSLLDENKKNLQQLIDTISKATQKEENKNKPIENETTSGTKLFSIVENELKKLIELKESIENSSKKKEENYLKTIRQISSKLGKLLNDNREESLIPMSENSFNEIRTQIVDVISTQLRNLRDKKIEKDQKETELINQINKLKQQRNDTTQRLGNLIKFSNNRQSKNNSDEALFLKVVEASELKYKTNETTIKDLEEKMKKLKNEVLAINTRLLGVLRKSIDDQQEENPDEIIQSIYKNIEIIQDQKENLLKESNSTEKKDLVFKNCLLSLLIMNDPKIDGNEYFNDENKLIDSCTKMVENYINLKKEMKNNFISVSQIDQIFKPVVSLLKDHPPKENHQLFLSFISKTFLSHLQTFSLIDKYATDVDLAFRSFDQLNQKIDGINSFKEMINGLKNGLDKIAAQFCSPSLLTVLYKFISMILKCIDVIQLNEGYSLSSY